MAEEKPQFLHSLAGKKIIIAGGGIAGLSLTLALFKQWDDHPGSSAKGPPPFEVALYERDAEDAIGREGYSLSIRSDSGGIQALQKIGQWDRIEAKIRETNNSIQGGLNMWDRNWHSMMRIPAHRKDGDTLRIPRGLLRGMLANAVLQDGRAAIHWATTSQSAKQLDDGRVRVTFSNGQTDDCDILVVADGASSKLRSVIRPDDNLRFARPVLILGTARFIDEVPAPLDKEYGMVISGKGVGVWIAPIDRYSAVWSISYLAKEPRTAPQAPLSSTEAQALIDEALDRGKIFNEPVQTIIKASDLSTVKTLNAKDKKPFAHAKGSNIIFIGDSNHAMSPFAGNGANLALADGCDLAKTLFENDSLEAAVAAYDKLSIPRAAKAIKQSHFAINGAHASGIWFWFMKCFFAVVRIFVRW